jgi:cell division protein FtsB
MCHIALIRMIKMAELLILQNKKISMAILNKIKYKLLAEVRKLRTKAEQKRREADRLDKEADEIEREAKKMSDK